MGQTKSKHDKTADNKNIIGMGQTTSKACSDSLIVAAIDFGTTYSGVAFSFKHEYERDPRKVIAKQWTGGQLVSLKGPTSALIKGDGTHVVAFGYEAESKYCELCDEGNHEDWYFFRRFKMLLHGDKNVKQDMMLEDMTGKSPKLSALKVFSLCIAYLKQYPRENANNQLMEEISEDDIHWVLTVPAIWNDTAKQFMRKAAENAGIDGRRLSIALEPEAASIYCRYIPIERSKGDSQQSLSQFKSGSKYLVLDAGGGTVDITVHEVDFTGGIKELHQASGGAWGGTKVDEAFEGLLRELLGKVAVDKFKKDCNGEYIELYQDFEMKKRNLPSDRKVTFKIPSDLATKTDLKTAVSSSRFAKKMTVVSDKLRVDIDIVKDLFLPTVNKIVEHVKGLLRHPSVRGCGAIVMVGGFSESLILQERVREAFPLMNVIIPDEASLAVLRGAVIFGHNPEAITERVCKYTYGAAISHIKTDTCTHPPGRTTTDKNGDERCHDIFKIHVKKGQTIKLGEKQTESIGNPIQDDQTRISNRIYASTEEHPDHVTDKGCQLIGQFDVPITGGRKGELGTTFMFDGTEIEVICEDKLTGKISKHRVEFLG